MRSDSGCKMTAKFIEGGASMTAWRRWSTGAGDFRLFKSVTQSRMSDLATRPPSVTVSASYDAMAIRFKPVGFRDLRGMLIFGTFSSVLGATFSGIGIWLLLYGETWGATAFAVAYLSVALPITAIAFGGVFLGALHMAGNEPELFVTGSKLTIQEKRAVGDERNVNIAASA